jgi:hypothetical protein
MYCSPKAEWRPESANTSETLSRTINAGEN